MKKIESKFSSNLPLKKTVLIDFNWKKKKVKQTDLQRQMRRDFLLVIGATDDAAKQKKRLFLFSIRKAGEKRGQRGENQFVKQSFTLRRNSNHFAGFLVELRGEFFSISSLTRDFVSIRAINRSCVWRKASISRKSYRHKKSMRRKRNEQSFLDATVHHIVRCSKLNSVCWRLTRQKWFGKNNKKKKTNDFRPTHIRLFWFHQTD